MKKLLIAILALSSFAFANEYSSTTYVRVHHSEPVYEYRPTYKPQKRYYEEKRENTYKSSDNNVIGLDTIVGATLGVVVGNQIGKGTGKDVARVAGGLIGAAVANNTRDQRDSSSSYETSYATYNDYEDDRYSIRDYDDRHGYRNERVLVGYKNFFRYDHEEHYKFSKYPLREVMITRTINY